MLVDNKWVPTFSKARYLMGRVEFAHWRAARERPDMAAVFTDSVKSFPVHDAGLVDLVETDHRITNEINLIPTVGHTPGHVSVVIKSKGEEALITGDFMRITRVRLRIPNGARPPTATPRWDSGRASGCSKTCRAGRYW